MTPIVQMICRQGQPVAVTVATDEATLSARVASSDRALVQAMCVYALEIAAGERPGPYRDDDAERYALAVTSHTAARTRSPIRRR